MVARKFDGEVSRRQKAETSARSFPPGKSHLDGTPVFFYAGCATLNDRTDTTYAAGGWKTGCESKEYLFGTLPNVGLSRHRRPLNRSEWEGGESYGL